MRDRTPWNCQFKGMLALALLLAGFTVAGAMTHLPVEARKALQANGSFKPILSVTNLPDAIVALCADSNGKLADPGKQWQTSDLIVEPSLPQKRMIWAAFDGKYYVVHYERGGRGHSFHTLVATQQPAGSKALVVWRCVGEKLNDFPAFVSAMEKGTLDDDPKVAH